MINQDFNSILELINTFPDEETCILHLEELRWNSHVVSPFDPYSKVYKCANNRYRCKETGKYFNVKTSTLFDNTKVKLQKWFIAIWLVTSHKKGISSLQLARDIKVTQKTAWFMLQRIKACFDINSDEQFDNTVKIDETYVGKKNKNRHSNKKVQQSKGRSTKDKTSVIGMVEHSGKVKAYIVGNIQSKALNAETIKNVKETTNLCPDEWMGYKYISRFYDHSIIKHNKGEYVRCRVHTNTIEDFLSLMKRGIIGIYHFISKKHLQKYVDEFVFRYNSRELSECVRFNVLLTNTGTRTTYKGLING